MSTEGNKAIVSGYMDQVWNKGRLDLFAEFIAQDVVGHANPGFSGAENMKQRLAANRNAFPDLQLVAHDVLPVEDKVVTRWTFSGTHEGDLPGMPATGKKVSYTGISIFRLAGGKIAEFWTEYDNLGIRQQLGFIPATEA